MKTIIRKRKQSSRVWLCLLVALVFLLPFCLKTANAGGRYAANTLTASAASSDVMSIEEYSVDIVVREDRKLEFRELITMRALKSGSIFTRSLPLEGDRYSSITAKCVGEEGFSYYVETDENDEFLNVCCELYTKSGVARQYEITYVMEVSSNEVENGMGLDVIGFGWTVPLNEVTVTMHFPSRPVSYEVYTDMFGAETENAVTETWEDGKTLKLYAEQLGLVYNEYNERVAGGITVEFSLSDGVLQGYTATRIFTDDMWKIVLGGLLCVALAAALLIFTCKKREVLTVVNIKAPDEMDPMKMGKWIDGSVNNEDITSMIYYFANKGYLRIDLTDEDDPELFSDLDELPDDAPVYEKTLFDGLFECARVVDSEKPFEEAEMKVTRAVKISEIAGKFYEASQTAIKQVPDSPTMYEKKSLVGYIGGALIGALLGFLVPLLMSLRVGGGYAYLLGVAFVFPMAVIAFIGYLSENYRYKWKSGKRLGLLALQILVAAVFTLLFVVFFAKHIMTGYEKTVLCLCAFGSCFITQSALSRTEKYLEILGDILGFKEFIVVTEEDKIKVMLEEKPELYYKVLPYAQVLGVTDEWEKKFEKILIEPPTWYVGGNMTVFDYLIINRCINRSMTNAMIRAAQAAANKGGGSFVGRSGGGGSFGGFGGGGHGGGGGSWR